MRFTKVSLSRASCFFFLLHFSCCSLQRLRPSGWISTKIITACLTRLSALDHFGRIGSLCQSRSFHEPAGLCAHFILGTRHWFAHAWYNSHNDGSHGLFRQDQSLYGLPSRRLGGWWNYRRVNQWEWNTNNLRLWRLQITPLHVEYTNYLLDHLGSDNWHAPATALVFRDDNANGIQDSGEPPIPGATVSAALRGQSQGGLNSETIDPFAFAIEEDLTNVSANVTLTVASFPTQDVLNWVFSQTVNAAGGMFFNGAQPTFLRDAHLRMDFYRPAQSVSILVGNAISYKPVYGKLEIFDSQNRSLGFVHSSALEKGEEERLSIFSPGSDIAYAVAYSDFEYLDSSMDGWFGSLKFTWPTEAATTDANGAVNFYQLPRESYEFSVSVPPEYDIVYPQTATHQVEFTAASQPTSLTFGVRGNRPPQLNNLSGTVLESAIAGQVIAKLR